MPQRRAHGSNQKAWQESPWRPTKIARLVDPTLDLPPDLNKAPTSISILTNKADPLHDDGIKFLDELKANEANVKHLDHPGSNWLGTAFDDKSFKEAVGVWKDQLFH